MQDRLGHFHTLPPLPSLIQQGQSCIIVHGYSSVSKSFPSFFLRAVSCNKILTYLISSWQSWHLLSETVLWLYWLINKHDQGQVFKTYLYFSLCSCPMSSSWEGHILLLVWGREWEAHGAGKIHPNLPIWGLSRSIGSQLNSQADEQVHPRSTVLFSSAQSLSCVRLFVTPWTAARQAALSIINSQSLLKLLSIVSMTPSNHLILCRPILLLPSIFPSITVFSKESVLHIRWPKNCFQLQHHSFQWIFSADFL